MERLAVGRFSRWFTLLFGLVLFTRATPLSAQFSIGTDVELSTRSVWRGLMSRNRPVIQPGLFASYSRRRMVLTAGAWTSIQPGSVGRRNLGTGSVFFGETDVWGEVAGRVGVLDLAAGFTGYYFDRNTATRLLHDVEQTHEINARAQISSWIVMPQVSAAYDFDAVKGLFLEGGATVRLPLWRKITIPVGSLLLKANSGWNFGQQADPSRPDEASYFEKRGLSYVDFSLAVTVGYLPLGILNNLVYLQVHSQINRDDRTKFVSWREKKDVTWWAGLTLTSIGPRCRPTRKLCGQ